MRKDTQQKTLQKVYLNTKLQINKKKEKKNKNRYGQKYTKESINLVVWLSALDFPFLYPVLSAVHWGGGRLNNPRRYITIRAQTL